jgi:hypothetical protein
LFRFSFLFDTTAGDPEFSWSEEETFKLDSCGKTHPYMTLAQSDFDDDDKCNLYVGM